MSANDIAQGLLAERGLNGCLAACGGDLYQLRGERDGKGVAVEIRGEPSELILTEAANIIASELIDSGDLLFAQQADG